MVAVAAPRPDPGRGVYPISVAAELVGSGVQNLRLYETRGLLKPAELTALVRRRTEEVLYALFAEEKALFTYEPARVPPDERIALERGPLRRRHGEEATNVLIAAAHAGPICLAPSNTFKQNGRWHIRPKVID